MRWNQRIGLVRTWRAVALILMGISISWGRVSISISIVGGPHDLTRPGRVWVPNVPSPCQVCHRLHGSTPQALTLPLRSLSPRDYWTRYTPMSDRNLACLRCHTRWDVLRRELPELQGSMPESRFLDSNLMNDHPIDMPVPPSLAFNPRGEERRRVLDEGRMLCVTCHEPHNSVHPALLRQPPSELCRSCHLDLATHYGYPVERCTPCHVSHHAPQKPLLNPQKTQQACTTCHPAAAAPGHPQGPAPPPVPPVRILEPMGPPPEAAEPSPPPTPDPSACIRCHSFHRPTHPGGRP